MGEVGLFRVVLQLRGIKIVLTLGQIFVLFKSYLTPLYFLQIVFPKFDPLTVWLYVLILGKMSEFILLSLRLSGIKISLVSD